ncbi:MAG: methyltransferase domain-containing protein [Phycisphaerales bacterium]|nr:MAG: methyltransferase domain-containing protein [Phycisphaerales bacterium]
MKRPAKDMPVTERLNALAEPVRLRMLRLLEREELTVGEVASVVQLPQSTVSRHLKVLLGGGWLARRSVGTSTLHRLLLDDLEPESRRLWIAVRDQVGGGTELGEDDRRLEAVLQERASDSQAFFGRIAGEWDSVRAELFGSRFTPLGLLGLLRPDWVVADLGCGTGNASEVLEPWVERVIAVDLSEPMLDAARKRLGERDRVEFRTGPLEKLPLADGSVDAAVCLLVLHHVAEPGKAIAEIRRVLRASRSGGVALIVDMVEHDRERYRDLMGHQHLGFRTEELEELMSRAGFATVTSRHLPAEPGSKGPGLIATVGWLDEATT